MLIGVLSDTHDRLPSSLVKKIAEVDEIWHLGDVCTSRVLASLEQPVYIVRGNCDTVAHWPHSLDLVREKIRFHLVHVPPAQIPEGIDVVVHGHTHIPRDETIHGVRFLNPGSVSKPRDSRASFGILEIEDGAIINWEIIAL